MDKPSVCDCLFEAMETFSRKIEKIVTHDPDNIAELACLYEGISGIDDCVKTLRKHGHLSDADEALLKKEMHTLYERCKQ
jgi:hypothetical protein